MPLNKKDFIKKFLKEDAKIVWPKEMKMVKMLLDIFPDEIFWNSLDLKFKLNSLCWLLSDDGRSFLKKEYQKYKLELPDTKKYELEKNDIAFETKLSYTSNNPLSLRDFLNLWQKKH
jgi:hypothetical protein